jgi:hypothetical protein
MSKKIKVLPDLSAVSSFLMEIFFDGSSRYSRLMVKSFSSFSRKHSEIAHLTKGSGFQSSLTEGKPNELTYLSQFPGGLMRPLGFTADGFALTPYVSVIYLIHPGVRLTLTANVSLFYGYKKEILSCLIFINCEIILYQYLSLVI